MAAKFPDYFAVLGTRVSVGEPNLDPVVEVDNDRPEIRWPWSTHDPFSSDSRTYEFSLAGGPDEMPEESIAYEADARATQLFVPTAAGPIMPPGAIAIYAPWHVYGRNWGIYVNEDLLGGFAQSLATVTSTPLALVAPLALRQILEHEWVHFAFEIGGSEIEDAIGAPRYRGYVANRYSQPEPALTAGPIEEVVASYAEVVFARHGDGGFKKLRPKGYTAAVRHLLDACPAGYSEYHLMENRSIDVLRAVMTRIADRPMLTHRWGLADDAEKAQVPLYWVGNPAHAPFFGALPKSAGPPSILKFEKWLKRRIKAEIRMGRGDHRKALLPGVNHPIDYDTGAGFLLPPEAKQFASALGLANIVELYLHVAEMRAPRRRRP